MSTGLAFAVVAPVAFLYMFYRAVESQWPESYSVLATSSSYWSSQSLSHYLVFRVAPVLVVTLFSTVASDRSELHAWAPAFLIPFAHWLVTSGRTIVRGAPVARRPNNYGPMLMVAAALFGAYLLVGAAAWLLREWAAPIVPALDEIVAGLWTSLAAGVVAAYLTDARVSGSPDADDILLSGIEDVTSEQREWCAKYATANDADVDILLTILVVEQTSRPVWFRRLENVAARFLKRRGTYGLMQVASDHPVSDERSVEIAATEHLAGLRIPTDDYDRPDVDALRSAFASYNADDKYVAMCNDVYWNLFYLEEGNY